MLFADGPDAGGGRGPGGRWLLVIVADVVAVALVPDWWVVPVLGLGNTIGLTAGGLALLGAVRRARGRAALRGTARAALAGLAGAAAGAVAGGMLSAAVPGQRRRTPSARHGPGHRSRPARPEPPVPFRAARPAPRTPYRAEQAMPLSVRPTVLPRPSTGTTHQSSTSATVTTSAAMTTSQPADQGRRRHPAPAPAKSTRDR